MPGSKNIDRKASKQDIWARPEMTVVFRAEIMPGKNRAERSFRIEKVLPNGRVTLHEFTGEHRQSSFEPLNFQREKSVALKIMSERKFSKNCKFFRPQERSDSGFSNLEFARRFPPDASASYL